MRSQSRVGRGEEGKGCARVRDDGGEEREDDGGRLVVEVEAVCAFKRVCVWSKVNVCMCVRSCVSVIKGVCMCGGSKVFEVISVFKGVCFGTSLVESPSSVRIQTAKACPP